MTGSVASLPSWADRKSCGICVSRSPQWFWIAQSLGFKVAWVWAAHETSLPRWLKAISGDTHFTTIPLHLPAVDVVFGDWAEVPSWVLHDSTSYGILCSTNREDGAGNTRRDRGSRGSRGVILGHNELGGVTSLKCRVTLTGTAKPLHWTSCALPTFLPTSVASVASDTHEEGVRAPAPGTPILSAIVLAPLGSGSVFHGGGLHPGPGVLRPKFLLRSVCHQPTGWCIRELTEMESWTVYDVPWRVSKLISSLPRSTASGLYDVLKPGRCLEHGARHLMRGCGFIAEGGVFSFPKDNLMPTSLKRLAVLDLRTGECVKRPRYSTAELDSVVDVITVGLGEVRLNAVKKGISGAQTKLLNLTNDRSNISKTLEMGQVEYRSDFNEVAGPKVENRSDFSEVAGPKVEKRADTKATKSDEDEVDIASWNKHLCSKIYSHLDPCAPAVCRAAIALQSFGLRWYRRRLLRSYFCWLHQAEKYQGVGIGLEHVVELDQCITPTIAVKQIDGLKRGIKTGFDSYRWSVAGRSAYCSWWQARFQRLRKELKSGRDALQRIANCEWWDWKVGSAPIHWKWPEWYQKIIQSGLPVWFKEAPKAWLRPQAKIRTQVEHDLIKRKIAKVRNRGYVESGEIDSLISFFAVPKGMNDIRMVYDGTASGLNDAIWVPRFPLPTVDTHLRSVVESTYMGDMDVGEMFVNFILHESMQALTGIDLTQFFGEKDSEGEPKLLWERWTRAAMGLKSSPYQAVQAMMVAKDVIRGDRHDPKNVFRWDSVRLNLPGSSTYDPALPWVSKIRLSDGQIAADLFVYVDDARTTGATEEECVQATRRVASVLNSLGIQDAPRKRRWASQTPGAWAGSIVETNPTGVYVTVSQEKWDKSRRYIGEIVDELASSKDSTLDRKALEKKRGFLIYVTRTYPSMVPYLKGIHHTLESYRDTRRADGWKMSHKELEAAKRSGAVKSAETPPPVRVKGAPRLRNDLRALQLLLESSAPPKRKVRSSKVLEIFYGFGDASAVGHSTNFQGVRRLENETFEVGDRIYYRYGHWCQKVSEESSNYRELLNLVESLEAQVASGRLQGAEVFLFTDNSTAEAVFWKGTSHSKKLFELMLRLRKVEMDGELLLHVIHVAGTRMIDEGADGGSRGDLSQGAMSGQPVLDFIPLHLSALERSAEVEPWIRSWWDKERGDLVNLTPEGWFDEGQTEGCFLWSPPPAAADAVVDQLGEARHKRPYGTHVVVVPRLMTGRWRKKMSKEADIMIEIPAGTSFWPSSMHEPLILFICLPLCRYQPWSFRGTKYMADLGRELREVWKNVPERGRDLLCELLVQTRGFHSMSESLVREVLRCRNWRSVSDPSSDGRGRIRKRRRRR
jgi:hypothetical protein